jgi:hypothetical protein
MGHRQRRKDRAILSRGNTVARIGREPIRVTFAAPLPDLVQDLYAADVTRARRRAFHRGVRAASALTP